MPMFQSTSPHDLGPVMLGVGEVTLRLTALALSRN